MQRWLLALVVAAGGGLVAGCGDDDDPRQPRPAAAKAAPPPTTSTATTPVPATEPELFAVRRPGGIRAGTVARLRRADGVVAATGIGRTQVLLRRGIGGGRTAPGGYAFPLDALVVEARAYGRLVPEARRLGRGNAVLSRTSARVRKLGPGDRLELVGGKRLQVAAVVEDAQARDAEVVVSRADAEGLHGSAQALVLATDAGAVRGAVPGGGARLIRLGGQRPRRSAIARAAQLKATFGEFAVRLPYAPRDAPVAIEPGWLDRNVVTRSVPILGPVTCHRAFVPPLRRALASLQRRGLSRLVDRAGFAGCYAPKRIPGSGSLSLHAWGLAIDLNARDNPPLQPSSQDPRLVAAMEREGFTWGGRWPTVPDPMHFELHRR